ncbi:MAG: terminase small subunit [Pseudomonadota bacterium]
MPRKLTAKEQRFVDEYVVDCNATQACKRAGYKGKNHDKIGGALLSKIGVAQAVQARFDDIAKQNGVTAGLLIQQAEQARQAAMKKGNHSAAVNAVSLKAKITGHLIQRSQNTMQVTGEIKAIRIESVPVKPRLDDKETSSLGAKPPENHGNIIDVPE